MNILEERNGGKLTVSSAQKDQMDASAAASNKNKRGDDSDEDDEDADTEQPKQKKLKVSADDDDEGAPKCSRETPACPTLQDQAYVRLQPPWKKSLTTTTTTTLLDLHPLPPQQRPKRCLTMFSSSPTYLQKSHPTC